MKELKPFTEVYWKSNRIMKEWRNKISKISRLAWDTEYEMVKLGHRKANVYHLHANSYDKDIERISLDGLVFLPILRSKTYDGFSHTHYPSDTLGQNVMVYGAMARDLKTAKKFRDANLKNDHKAIGKLLGYPKCCCEYFNDIWLKNGIVDPQYESALRTDVSVKSKNSVLVKGHPYTNQMLRYFGIRITPWFPCSFSCKESIKRGEQWFKVISDTNKELSKELYYLLDQPMKWSLLNAIIYVDHPVFYGMANGYWTGKKKEVMWNGNYS